MARKTKKITLNNDWFGNFDSFADSVIILNKSAKIVYANKQACRLFKYSSKSILNKNASKLFPGFNQKTLNNLKKVKKIDINGISKTKKPFFAELTLNGINTKKAKFYAVFVRDISKLKKLTDERDMLRSESGKYAEKLTSLFENVDVLLWSVIEDEKGELYYEQVNEAFASAIGKKPSAYNGKHLKELGTGEEYHSIVHSLNKAKELGVYTYEKELRHSGKTKTYVVRIISVPGGKGGAKHFIGSATDITQTKLAEKQIIDERNKASLYFDAARVMLVVLNKNQEVHLINKKGSEILGYEEADIVGKNWFDNFVPDDIREYLRKKFSGFVSGTSNPSEYFENPVITKNGLQRYILWHNTILRDEKGKITGVLSSGEDISDRKLMEELLKISERKYRELARNAPVAVARLDAFSDRYEFVNDEFTRQSGYTLDEFNSLSKRDVYEMVHPDDRDDLYAAFKVWVKGGYKGVFHHEYRIISKTGENVWLDAYFYSEFDSKYKLIAVNQIYIDTTDRKKTEEKLQILGHAFESTTEMITITDSNNCLIFINRAFEEKYGYTESELIGKKADMLGSVKNPPGIHDTVFKDTKEGGWEGELINTKKDGTEFPILLSTSKIIDKSGRAIGYIGVARDITELKNAYDQLRHSLKEKEILLKEVYHRVKNNMQVISSLLNIQSQTVTEPSAVELFRETQNRVRIMQLIHEKLYKSQDLSKIDFSLYIRDLTSQLRRAYPVSRNVEVKINSEGIYLGVDKAIPCGLIINELVSNSYKYAFRDIEKGEIYIELTSVDGGKFRLVVSDNGVGIPENINVQNTESMGMVLVTTLTDQLEGTLEINRTHGTSFTICF